MRGIDQDVKDGKFSKAYLLFGTEEYLKSYYKKKLCGALCDPEDTMNYTRFEGKDVNPAAVIDLAETLPFFKDRRLILIENSGFFKGSCDELADYLKSPCETTCFVFCENDVDKRSRMYKAVKNAGRIEELVSPGEDELVSWCAALFKRYEKKVRRGSILRLFEQSGTDMNVLKNEIEKVVSYMGGREIVEDADIDEVCTREIRNQIFDMVEAITDKKSRKAFSLYYDLLALKEPPMRILFLIARQFNMLMQVKELSQITRDPKELAGKTGLHPYVAKKYLMKCPSYSMDYLKQALEECLSLEQDVKSGKLTDTMAVELLIAEKSK
ncbi:MAG: DNA polymerase III subunit delta [Lachnospiraceae bacterium]|nr:DNA polymerase III subunit delta [Lachnospiraceae bacterium]